MVSPNLPLAVTAEMLRAEQWIQVERIINKTFIFGSKNYFLYLISIWRIVGITLIYWQKIDRDNRLHSQTSSDNLHQHSIFSSITKCSWSKIKTNNHPSYSSSKQLNNSQPFSFPISCLFKRSLITATAICNTRSKSNILILTTNLHLFWVQDKM